MRPFRIDVHQQDLDDLVERIARTRWPAEIPEVGWDRGVPLGYLRELAEYWRTGFDWRAAEARLNRYPQYRTEIDGTTVHFLHIRSESAGAQALLLTHGWPGSVAEFVEVIDPLVNGPVPFHVVVPAIPGFGFSGPTGDSGWGIERVAAAWGSLMDSLGYPRFLAQGGDAGSAITLELARQRPESVAGVHINLLPPAPPPSPDAPAALNPVDQGRLARMMDFEQRRSGYIKIQSTRPQTLAYALTDSPVGQLAWIVEKYREWSGCVDLPEEAVARDHILTAVTIYWLTATAGSSAQLYYEGADYLRRMLVPGPGERLAPVTVPAAVAVFPQDFWLPVRAWAGQDLPNIMRWTEFPAGGHFAALEQPAAFVDDVRAFARQLAALPVG
jgi:epoxide hydrolase